jgi:acetoin utilization protein AcuB
MRTVAEIMTPDPITLNPDDTIGQAEEIMFTNRIRQLPVVVGSQLVGIISDRDLRSFLSGRLFTSSEERDAALNTRIEAVMSTAPLTVSPDDDLREAIELMIDEKIGGIPVIEEEKGLVGIITYVDVLRCFFEELES